MDAYRAIMKDATPLVINLVSDEGIEEMGEYTFPPNASFLVIDGNAFGRMCDLMYPSQLIEWGYGGQEVWIAEINEKDYIRIP